MAVQLSQHHLLKRLSFPHCIVLPPLLKINWLLVVGVWVYFWDLSSVPFMHRLFSCQYHAILITVAVSSEVWKVMPPALFFFLRISLATVGLYGCIYISGVFVLVLWKISWVIWLTIVLNLWIALDNSPFSNILKIKEHLILDIFPFLWIISLSHFHFFE